MKAKSQFGNLTLVQVILALMVICDCLAGVNVFLPSTNGKNWDDDANWSAGNYPDAAGAEAAIGLPTAFKKNKGWRNIHIDSHDVTVGTLEIACGGCTNRIDTGDGLGNLTFDNGDSSALLVDADADGCGLVIIDLDEPNRVILNSDLTVVVTNRAGDAEFGGVWLKGAWAGNGKNLKKTGDGLATLDLTNVADTVFGKIQCDGGTLAILKPIRAESVTKSGTCRVLASAENSADALTTSVVCTKKVSVDNLCLFVPTEAGGVTFYGGFVAPELQSASACAVYVLKDDGDVAFNGARWTACERAEVSIVEISKGIMTYAVTVPLMSESSEVNVLFEGFERPMLGGSLSAVVVSGDSESRTFAWSRGDLFGSFGEVFSTEKAHVLTQDDLEHWLRVVVTVDGREIAAKSIWFSKLPVLYLNTDDGRPVTVKDEYKDASLVVQGNERFAQQYDGRTQIKGRGNSSWLYPQKPFKLKLDKKADFFGFGKNKHWVLLSSFADVAAVRNEAASALGRELGLVSMDMTPVELIVNGEHQGMYELSEHVRVDKNRVDIFNWEDEAEAVADDLFEAIKESAGLTEDDHDALAEQMVENLLWITAGTVDFGGKTYNLSDYGLRNTYNLSGGYLFELDAHADAATTFRTRNGLVVMVDTPEFLRTNPSMSDFVRSFWNRFEEAYSSPTGMNLQNEHFSDLADVDTMVAYWLVNEVFGNGDAWENSRFAFKEPEEKLRFGIPWDFDFGVGSRAGYSSDGGNWVVAGESYADETRPTGNNLFRFWARQELIRQKAYVLYWKCIRPWLEKFLKADGVLDDWISYRKEAGFSQDACWYGAPMDLWGKLPDRTVAEDSVVYRNYLTKRLAWLDAQFATVETLTASLAAGYAITYRLNGGETTGAMLDFVQPGKWFVVPAPTRAGYVFCGWRVVSGLSDHALCSVEVDVSEAIPNEETLCGGGFPSCSFANLSDGGEVVLSAVWKAEYKVEYSLNGGTAGGDMPTTMRHGKWFSIPAPLRPGWVFRGWQVTHGCMADALYSETPGIALKVGGVNTLCGGGLPACSFANLSDGREVVLSAVWEVGYNVTYYLNGGEATGLMPDFARSGTWFAVPKPRRSGCVFRGWQVIHGRSSNALYSETPNVALKVVDGNTLCGSGLSSCSFANLSDCGEVVLSAIWEPIADFLPAAYNVTYYLNGGEAVGVMPDFVQPGTWFAVPKPRRSGCLFCGWQVIHGRSTNALYSETPCVALKVADENMLCGGGLSSCSFANLSDCGEVVLSAIWKEGYNVTYYLNGGKATGSMPGPILWSKWFSVPAPKRSGCVFRGWRVIHGWSSNALYSETPNVALKVADENTLCGGGLPSCSFANLSVCGEVVLSAIWEEVAYVNAMMSASALSKVGIGSSTEMRDEIDQDGAYEHEGD